MVDWTTFVTGSAAGGLVGVVVAALANNVTQQVLEEWRDLQLDKRTRAQERRTEERALREARRALVLPALDTLFDACDTSSVNSVPVSRTG